MVSIDFDSYYLFDSEFILTILFFLFSIIMFMGSFQYSQEAATFPRFFSAVMGLSASILVIRKLALNHGYQEEQMSQGGGSIFNIVKSPPPRLALSIMLLFYIIISYYIGLLWTTPLFILIYSLWTQQSRKTTTILLAITLLILFLFIFIIGTPLHEGQV